MTENNIEDDVDILPSFEELRREAEKQNRRDRIIKSANKIAKIGAGTILGALFILRDK